MSKTKTPLNKSKLETPSFTTDQPGQNEPLLPSPVTSTSTTKKTDPINPSSSSTLPVSNTPSESGNGIFQILPSKAMVLVDIGMFLTKNTGSLLVMDVNATSISPGRRVLIQVSEYSNASTPSVEGQSSEKIGGLDAGYESIKIENTPATG